MEYNKTKAVDYALKWALNYNPNYYDFSSLGGDCTNFASQALFAGAPAMNYKKTFGWYYISLNNRSPSWTGVDEFYNFLINNQESGPHAREISFFEVLEGDFIQLGNQNGFYHTLIVTGFSNGVPKVCSHSVNRKNALLTDYYYERLRIIRILGYNE